jgi:hypothetical protein
MRPTKTCIYLSQLCAFGTEESKGESFQVKGKGKNIVMGSRERNELQGKEYGTRKQDPTPFQDEKGLIAEDVIDKNHGK